MSAGLTSLRLPLASIDHPRVSPDGKLITYSTDEGNNTVIWVYDLSGTAAARRLAVTGKNRYPIWSADSERIAYQSDREGDLGIWWQRADGTGTATRLTKAEQGTSHIPDSWQPKGDLFLYEIEKGTFALWSYSAKDGKSAAIDAVHSTYPINAVFSPDGLWVAYSSADTGNPALSVLPFPPIGTSYRVSQAQGLQPLWSADGKELFFNPAPSQYVKVGVITSPKFTFTNPVQLPRPFQTGGPQVVRMNDMTPDGKILGIILPGAPDTAGGSSGTQLQVVLNWFNELKARVPVK